MHKGKTYPYSPVWWAATANFWPFLAPWKVRLFFVQIDTPSWEDFGPWPSSIVSDPSYTLDGQSIVYHWSTPWTANASDFTISFGRTRYGGDLWTHFVAQISLHGTLLLQQFGYEPYNIPQFGTYGTPFRDEDSPFAGGYANAFPTVPATYSEGGSP